MSSGVQGVDDLPHGFVGVEDVSPSLHKSFHTAGESQGFSRPREIVIGCDPTGFEFVFPLKNGVKPGIGILSILRYEAFEGREEVNANNDVSNIVEEIHGLSLD